MMNTGQLIKLKIVQYEDERFENATGNSMLVQINPTKYSRNISVEYNEEQEQGTQGNNPGYSKTPPEEMQFEFVFDESGAIPESKNVEDEIKSFKELVYFMEGDKHRPNFLKIVWGPLSFNCVLKSLTINYTLFKPDGTALRATLNSTFMCIKEEERRAAEQGHSSPDLTHVRYTKEGESLPFMTHKIYRSPKLYLLVAKYNGLRSLRNIRPNTRLVFPPIERSLL